MASPNDWSSGRCSKGHDITDETNVRIVRVGDQISRRCRVCHRKWDTARRHGITSATPGPLSEEELARLRRAVGLIP